MLAAGFFGLLPPAMGRDGGTEGDSSLRFICLSSLAEDQEVVLASQDAGGEWHEHGTVKLGSPSITDWMPGKVGELHLAVREDKALKSICRFSCPAVARRALVVLKADVEKGVYEASVVDPVTAGFVKGSTLIVNLSPIPGLVRLGPDEHRIEAGQQLVAKPVLEENGMYRLTASRLDDAGKPVLCHDRYVSGNPDSREMVFLLPHKSRGLRVFSMPMFGEFN